MYNELYSYWKTKKWKNYLILFLNILWFFLFFSEILGIIIITLMVWYTLMGGEFIYSTETICLGKKLYIDSTGRCPLPPPPL
jgi:hypothetical protein